MTSLHEQVNIIAEIDIHLSDQSKILEQRKAVQERPVHDIHEERHLVELEFGAK